MEDIDFQPEPYWEDEQYVINQNEADDYRHEMDDYQDEPWEAEHDWERDDGWED